MKPDFMLIDAATGEPAAAYRTTIAVQCYDNVQVQDLDQHGAENWLETMIDNKFVIAGSNAQCIRLCNNARTCEAEIWGIGAIRFPSRIWESRVLAEDAAG